MFDERVALYMGRGMSKDASVDALGESHLEMDDRGGDPGATTLENSLRSPSISV